MNEPRILMAEATPEEQDRQYLTLAKQYVESVIRRKGQTRKMKGLAEPVTAGIAAMLREVAS